MIARGVHPDDYIAAPRTRLRLPVRIRLNSKGAYVIHFDDYRGLCVDPKASTSLFADIYQPNMFFMPY